jgi:uncharacterized protein (DUF885 family)
LSQQKRRFAEPGASFWPQSDRAISADLASLPQNLVLGIFAMQLHRRSFLVLSAAASALAACGGQTESARLGALLDRLSTDLLHESPEYATMLAVPEERAGGSYIARVSDASREAQRKIRGIYETGLGELRALDRTKLTPQEAVSLDVVATSFENDIADITFEPNATSPYVVSQLTGAYTEIPDFLDSAHPLTDQVEVDAYIERLSGYARQLDQETALIAEDSAAGFTPPDFAIDKALQQLGQFAALRPAETVLVQSLNRRLPAVAEIAEAGRPDLLTRAEAIVRDEVLPAYGRQIDALRAVRGAAVHDAGCWRLPNGEERYAAALKSQTTTNMTADEIHELGVELVAELGAEMDAIFRSQGMTRGSVSDRVRELARRPEQLYANTDAGRAQLLAELNAQMAHITTLMPQYFGVLAQAGLEIKRVPTFTEAGAPGGYYQSAALDGSRPGAYYINLRDTAEWPKFKLPTLTYHEGTPGHHWQVSIAQESQGLPFIRSALLGFNAYQEGWGLYAEQLADEAGVYADNPFGRIGYLQSASFRASRLVVDTGMHAKRWTREQAIESMLAVTGDQPSYTTREIERYAVWPGQACGYMVGRQAIGRMRDSARAALGDAFDIKGFHDTLLSNGAMPLSVTQAQIEAWVASVQGRA